MKNTYENELKMLQNWIYNTNNILSIGNHVIVDMITVNNTCYQIETISNEIANEYPFYAKMLNNIRGNLFNIPPYGSASLNNCAFGELYVIINHIAQEPINLSFWNKIHPRIIKISQGLYSDGYPDSAAEKAIKEVESRLRELFHILKPNTQVPTKIGDVIGALLSEHGAYHFADLSTDSGKNYRRGIQCLFEGLFAAYRNPSAHQNIPYSKREAMEQIMLASQLMYVLDNPMINIGNAKP